MQNHAYIYNKILPEKKMSSHPKISVVILKFIWAACSTQKMVSPYTSQLGALCALLCVFNGKIVIKLFLHFFNSFHPAMQPNLNKSIVIL